MLGDKRKNEVRWKCEYNSQRCVRLVFASTGKCSGALFLCDGKCSGDWVEGARRLVEPWQAQDSMFPTFQVSWSCWTPTTNDGKRVDLGVF